MTRNRITNYKIQNNRIDKSPPGAKLVFQTLIIIIPDD